MSVSREEMLIEANRRGLLKGEQKAQFDEAVRRGLIQAPADAQPARGTPEYERAKAAELAGEVAKFSGKLTPEQSSDRLNFMGNAGATFVANMLSIPHATGELLSEGGDLLQTGTGALAAKIMGQPANLRERYAQARAEPSMPSSLLLKLPDPDASDVMTAARGVLAVPGQIGQSIRAFQQGGGEQGGQAAPNPLTDIMAALRGAREAQTTSEEQFPAATTAGRTVGDIATLATLRPSRMITTALRGAEAPAATEGVSSLNAAVRKVAGGLGKAAEAGFDGAVMAALGDGDPAKTAAYTAGTQAAGSAALEAKGYLMRNPLKSFATLFLAHQMWKSVLPGSQNVFESQDKAVNELVGAYSLGVLASAAGAGRPTGPIASALSAASRAGIASVITQLQEADKQGQGLYDRVLTRMTEDPEYFGREARDRLERAANSDKPRALLDEIDRLMGSSWFKQKYDAMAQSEAETAKKKVIEEQPQANSSGFLRASPDSWLNKPLPMEGRAALLPLRRTDWPMMGDRQWALPGVLASAINAVTAPGRALSGTEPFDAPSEGLNFASTFAGGGLGASRLAEVPAGSIGMNAWHGSPHKFDAFDLSKIGTGEGAQAYGHGLYFAESSDVAKTYMAVGEPAYRNAGVRAIVDEAMQAAHGRGLKGEEARRSARNLITSLAQNRPPYARQQWYDAANNIDSILDDKFGNLYHVDIPDEAVAEMLDWDKPLKEQPAAVRELIGDQMQVYARPIGDGSLYMDVRVSMPGVRDSGVGVFPTEQAQAMVADKTRVLDYLPLKGEYVYKRLETDLGGKEAASARLKSLGIPGIRYLDAGSRGAGNGTRNLVLFDDKLAKIVERR